MDNEIEGIGSGVEAIEEPEQDYLSNIIGALNEVYQRVYQRTVKTPAFR